MFEKFSKQYILSNLFIFTVLACFLVSICFWHTNNITIIRAVIDIGSGATKLTIAKVDLGNRKIVETIYKDSWKLDYQEDLSRNKGSNFSNEMISKGFKKFQEIKEICNLYKVKKIVGVATASFRKAHNAKEYIDSIKSKHDIKIHIIDHKTEGMLAYLAAINTILDNTNHLEYSKNDYLIWDIGAGSLQMLTSTLDSSVSFHLTDKIASIPFKNHIIENIQHKSLNNFASPNPMTRQDINKSLKYAANFTKEIHNDILFKLNKNLNNKPLMVIGVGDLFNKGIVKLLNNSEITQNALKKIINSHENLSDHEFQDKKYANVSLSNVILVLSFMQELDIQVVKATHVNTADGLFFLNELW